MANLKKANLREAELVGTKLDRTDLSYANLIGVDAGNTDFHSANLSYAKLCNGEFFESYFTASNLQGADLRGASLMYTSLIRTNLNRADISGCNIHGVSAWRVQLESTIQSNLIITNSDEPTITVDNLEVAQFIYLLLNNQKIRQTIDTITSQVVLILGSFPLERKEVINALSKELRSQKYSPVIFDLEVADTKDFRATVRTLANMARFVLVDPTGIDGAIREIADAIIPRCVVPIRPLLLQGSQRQEYELLRELQRRYRWVLAPYHYKDLSDLQTSFQEKVLQPIYDRMVELKQKKPLKLFLGYASEDVNMLKILKTHLRLLERSGLIEIWDDQDVAPGEEKGKEIERHIFEAHIVLLLISPDFLSSHDCYDIQMSIAIERHEQAEARVIPVLLRPCAWQSTPLKDLLPLPKNGKPISKQNKDEVFFEVSEGIGEVIKSLG